jgi:uncharacterized protein YyaL (SSP411 family)
MQFKDKAIMKTIASQYRNLTDGEYLSGVRFAAKQLIKIGIFSEEKHAINYVNEFMQKMQDNTYKQKFLRIFTNINTTGIALKQNATYRIYHSMALQKSILDHFRGLDYHNSEMKKAIHGAKGVFATMPTNTAITFKS